MKNKSKTKLIRLGLAVAVCGTIIALLEVLHLHPQFSIGNFHAYWTGVNHMDFTSGTMTDRVAGRESVIQRDFDLGPLKLAIEV